MNEAPQPGRPLLALVCALVLLAIGAGLALLDPGTFWDPLTAILLVCAGGAQLASVNVRGTRGISGAFLCGMLAAGLLGPAAAFLTPVVSFGAGWILERDAPRRLVNHMAGATLPTVLAAVGIRALDLDPEGAAFPFVLAGFGLAMNLMNFAIVSSLADTLDGARPITFLMPVEFLPAVLLNVAIAAAIAAVYAQSGLAVMALVLLIIVGFTYMARLLVHARERTREYANLSWGVLSGLIRTLDARDRRAARHCAAVARFARDIAAHVGMDEGDQELAHTAGLLHDIGRFALSDRVMERGTTLTEDDWQAIRRHPEIGADLLRDIGVYGPLSEIIIAHHERPDGKGYPRRLTGDEIPEIAKIIAVAEVYDTLTAPDTYRTQLSSFEALNELRRVAGAQLDAVYVEALAALLAGQGTEYRHADEADYDEELAIERRINEAAAP